MSWWTFENISKNYRSLFPEKFKTCDSLIAWRGKKNFRIPEIRNGKQNDPQKMLSPILSNDSFKWKSNVEVTRRWTAYLWPPHAASTGRNARSVGWEGRRRVEEMARASVPRVSLPRGAYLSLRCARDILISYIYIYIHVSPLLSSLRSIRLSTSLGLRFHPFRPVLFLIYRRSPLSLFIYLIPLLFPFIDDYLARFLSFVLCIHARGTRLLLSLPFPSSSLFLLSADGFCGPSRRDRRRYRYRYRPHGLCLFWRATLWKIVRREGIRTLVKVEEDLLNR